jgi:hypothetical protein
MTSGWRPSTSDLLNLRDVPRRYDEFWFQLCDRRNRPIGEVHPDMDKSPTITWDTQRAVHRTLDSFYLPADEAADINPLTYRVRPYVRLQDGAQYSLGVFLWDDANLPLRPWGYESQGKLLDKTHILNQPTITPFSLARYSRPLIWIFDHITSIPEFNSDYWIDPNYATNYSSQVVAFVIAYLGEEAASKELGSPVNWQGGTTHLTIANDVMALVHYLPLYCNRDGTLIFREAPPLDLQTPELIYDLGNVTEHAAVVDGSARINFLGTGTSIVQTTQIPVGEAEVDVSWHSILTNPQPAGGFSTIAGRLAASNRSWDIFRNNTTSRWGINVSANGSSVTAMNFATTAAPLATPGYWRVTYRNEGANRVARLYTGTGPDGPWTLAETVSTPGNIVLYPSSAPLVVGASAPSGSGMLGSMQHFRYRTQVGGSLIAGWSAASLPDGTSGFYGMVEELWQISFAEIFNDSRAARTDWVRGRIIENSLVRSQDYLTAPNYVVVTDTAANQTPLRGVWRAPASAPHSEVQRGYAVGKYITVTGMTDQAEIDREAQRQGEYLMNAGAWAEWLSPVDPRHEAYDVLGVTGERMLETTWSIVCVPGQPMKHKALRIFSDLEVDEIP